MRKLLVLLFFFSATTLAKESSIDVVLEQCKNEHVNVSDMAINDCYQAAIKSWDKMLNAEYKQLMSDTETSEEFKDSLKKSQLVWIKYKDQYTETIMKYYNNQKGSYWGIVGAENVMNITKNKAIELHKLRISNDPSASPDD
ncbi:DUF1311 domain-containing protein [Cronobacter sakazakii]|uniref:lysozyme inhibitor LprI family protein n=1 Tax=Cronobacter sakazakii TaxID=28141 RepID=UPI000CF13BEF|nr:lysozyme inhibitor LprI family protein [Cronobacter sakazakii]EGT5183347.1 DUF1311 domain-containing protein [Cronobacter sakazakii]EGT5764851.1 DUF1311 domain-containing protein [Cronobacter sakazakii]EJG0741507.1 DUF1311 domain-containing protein [Cronobacter sakazakii]EJG0745238.1 DUF1311 domain-containing protein [Cronobacter sakazakii]ELY2535299.1 DUF1311 domain-containing protein [Cronobacter sakazakii]